MALSLTTVLLAASALFALFLAVRTFGIKVCAACAAFACAWIGLLALFYLGWGVDPVIIGILMGGSVVGVMYLLREKLPEEYQLFTFPFLASGFSLAYFLLAREGERSMYFIVGVLWLFFAAVFLARNNEVVRGVAKRLIECCKNW